MANSKNEKQQPGKKLDAKGAQKLREQLANRIAELSDDELATVAGGAATPTWLSILPVTITQPGGSGSPGLY